MDWNTASAEDAARRMLEHREGGQRLPVPPAGERLADPDRAYAIQEALEELLTARGARPIGYKIGATNAVARATLGTDGPFYGRLYDAVTDDGPASLPALPGFFRVYEPEIALLIGRDLEPSDTPFDAEAIMAATEAVLPGIEIVGTRLEPWTEAGVPMIVADNGAHGCWIRGAAVRDWSGIDLMALPVSLAVDGEVHATGAGRNVDGGPFGVAAWLANALAKRGRSLRAGDYVTTGTAAAPVPVAAGETVRADFGPLGVVELTIAPSPG